MATTAKAQKIVQEVRAGLWRNRELAFLRARCEELPWISEVYGGQYHPLMWIIYAVEVLEDERELSKMNQIDRDITEDVIECLRDPPSSEDGRRQQ